MVYWCLLRIDVFLKDGCYFIIVFEISLLIKWFLIIVKIDSVLRLNNCKKSIFVKVDRYWSFFKVYV